MSEDHPFERTHSLDEPFVDQSILIGLLSIGDDSMRRDLCAQLMVDFQRLAGGLDSAEPVIISTVAHELKGLSATIGAQRLADMSQTLHHAAESVSPSALSVLTNPVRREITEVLEILGSFQQRFQ